MIILFKIFYGRNSNQGLDYNKEEMGYIIFLCSMWVGFGSNLINIIFELSSELCTHRPSL